MAEQPRLDRVPPQNVDAERAVLGAMLMNDPSSKMAISDSIRILNRDDCFYKEAHRKIFEAIKDLFNENTEVDLITVSRQLELNGHLEMCGGVPYLDEMLDSSVSAANASYYADIVKEEADKRMIIHVSSQSYSDAFDETISANEILDKTLSTFLNVKLNVADKPPTLKSTITEVFKEMQERSKDPQSITGIPFGIREIDEMIGGLLSGDMVILAARPGVGKSTWVQNVAQYLCAHEDYKSNVVIFSLEMKAKQIVARIFASEARVPFTRFRSSHFEDTEWPKLALAAGNMSRWNLNIEDKAGITTTDMRSALYRVTAEKGKPDLVILDYLQLLRPVTPTGKRTDDVTQISQDLKNLAMDLDVPLLVVSQLNRNLEARPDKRPQLSDLRASGSIEQDADIVCFIYREDYHDRSAKQGPCEFIISKQRMGPTGTVRMNFDIEEARFRGFSLTTGNLWTEGGN
jgi:replicative DNA helicase